MRSVINALDRRIGRFRANADSDDPNLQPNRPPVRPPDLPAPVHPHPHSVIIESLFPQPHVRIEARRRGTRPTTRRPQQLQTVSVDGTDTLFQALQALMQEAERELADDGEDRVFHASDDIPQNGLSFDEIAGVNNTFIVPKNDRDEMCSVCQETFRCDKFAMKLQCGHTFHTTCIGTWLGRKPTCAVCRAQIGKGK